VRVLVIDDHPIVLAGCQLLVGSNSNIDLFGADTVEKALAAFDTKRPDVVVLDLQMPGLPTTKLLQQIIELDPAARIVIFTTNDDPLLAARTIELGAKGFVSKGEDPKHVVAAMREVAAGRYYMSPEVANKVATLRIAPKAVIAPKITPRERDILNMLAAGKSMTEIAATINLSYKTISAICNRMRSRFDARSTIELVRIAVLLGIC
jgi:DNA-binding NarL/FixJ family response regulator